MFANSLPLDARGQKLSLGGAFSLNLAGASEVEVLLSCVTVSTGQLRPLWFRAKSGLRGCDFVKRDSNVIEV